MQLTKYEISAIIGMWRMGANGNVIVKIIGCTWRDAMTAIKNYEDSLKK